MIPSAWRLWRASKSTAVATSRRSARQFRPILEPLETRNLLSFAAPVSYNIGTQADGFVPNAAPINVVTADFNGDGKLDLVVAHKVDNSIYFLRGNGDGTFQTAVQTAVGEGIEGREFAGDFNNDGKPDVFLPGAANQAIVLLGNGNGTFQPRIDSSSFSVSGTYPRGWTVGDFNNDGKLDVACTLPSNSADSGGYIVLLGNGNGTFQTGLVGPMVLHYSRWCTTGDFNLDGKLDLAVADGQGTSSNTNTMELSILLGNGNGTFQAPVHYASPQIADAADANATANPEDVAVADVNGDGKLDAIVSDYDNTINVFLGNGDGTFQAARSVKPGEYPRSVVPADVNHDGKIDLIVTNVGINTGGALFASTGVEPGSVAVLLGNGDGTFQTPTQLTPFDWPGWSAVADFNGDGWADIAATRVLDGHSVNVLLNNGLQDSRFVKALYTDFLGRTAGAAEVAGWLAALPQMGQAGVASAISHSTEAFTRLVKGWYVEFLGRPSQPADSEVTAWVYPLVRGATEEQVLAGILGSGEFAARANALIGGTNANDNYVRALYALLLRRTPGASEVNGWTSGLTFAYRGQVAVGFLGSDEVRSEAVRTYYGDPSVSPLPFLPFFPTLLRRPGAPSSAEVYGWMTTRMDLLAIEVAFAGSNEFYATS